MLVSYPGASTTEMRDAIVRPLEDQLAGAPDLDHLETAIQPGQASIVAVFQLSSNQNDDLVQVQGRVQNGQHSLPNDVQTPQIAIYNPSEAVVVSLVLRSRTLSVGDLSSLVVNKIVPSLEQLEGVSFVQQNGTVTPSIQVAVDPQKLVSSSGFTLTDVVSDADEQQRPRTGRHPLLVPTARPTSTCAATSKTYRRVAEPLARLSPAALRPGPNVWSTQARLFRIGDVANVTDTYETQRVFAYSNGMPCSRARHPEVGRHERGRNLEARAGRATRTCAAPIPTCSSRSSTCNRPTRSSS